ncbi:MAG: c-type cytochrome, partial [Gemmataceae bacterium]
MTKAIAKLTMACRALATALGCSSSPPPPKPTQGAVKTTPSADPRAEAKKTFVTHCARCHGLDGRGDGPGIVSERRRDPI